MPLVAAGAALVGGSAIAAGGIGAAFAVGGLTTAVAQIGLGMILSGASQALMPTPKLGGKATGTTFTARSPIAPREIVYGEVRKGGTIVFIHETGSKNQFLHLVIALAGHEVESIGAVYFDGEEAIQANGTINDRWDGSLFIEKRLGATDQTALDELQNDAPGLWTVDHRLAGVAHVHLRLSYDPEVYPNGLPQISFDMEGKNDVLDPRTSTRGYTRNAALCAADYMANARYSIGATIGSETGTDSASLIAAANVCDEAVPTNDTDHAPGGTEPRYQCDGVLSLSVDPKQNIEALLSAMAGTAAWPGGAWRIHAGAYRTPVVHLTEDDVREEGLSAVTRVTQSENFNGVRGRFVSPINDWQPDDFPAYQSATYLAEDNAEESWDDITLPFTTSPYAAQRLARIRLERVRRQITVQLHGKLQAYEAMIGEVITLDYARWGWAAKPFDVQNVAIGFAQGDSGVPVLVTELTLRETSPLAYSWTASEEQIYAAAPRTTLPDPFDIDPPGQPQITERLYVTRDQTVRALLDITWGPSPAANAVRYQIQIRRTFDEDGAATGDPWRTFGGTDQLNWLQRDIEPGTWEVRVKAMSALGVSSDYSTATIEALGVTAAPVALVDVTIQQLGGLAILKWATPSDLDVRFGGRIAIRHSNSTTPTWSNSVSLDLVAGNNTLAAVPLRPGSYLLRPIDGAGNFGPVTEMTTKGIQAIAFANLSSLTEDPTFSGTKTGVTVNGANQLTLTSVAGPHPATGLYEFSAGIDLTTVKSVRVRPNIDVAAENLAATIDDREENIDDWDDFDDSDGADIDVLIEARYTDDDPAGTPTWTGWQRVDSTEEEFRGAEFRATLSTGGQDYNVLVDALSIEIDEVA